MKVTLISYTPDAREVLLFTKNTRLHMTGIGLEDIKSWPEEKKAEELAYMKGTIQSSWEFCDYMFMIEGVTRAFTHQLVRHRVGVSFAQQAQRAVDMTGFEYETGPSIASNPVAKLIYDQEMERINESYQRLILDGDSQVNKQDARGILPTNILTNICMKINLRALHEMELKRLCVKAQGEFQEVGRAMKVAVEEVHPWAADFIKVQCAWNGTCIFPTFPVADCPVKPLVYDPVTAKAYGGGAPGSLVQIEKIWREQRAEAQPVVIEEKSEPAAVEEKSEPAAVKPWHCDCDHPESVHGNFSGCLVVMGQSGYCQCSINIRPSTIYDANLQFELSRSRRA